jgi:hypothetical protein
VKHARKTLAAVALFGLAPLVGCDQNGIEDASTTEGTTQQPPRDTTPPPPEREPPPAPEPGGIDDPSAGG